MNTTDTIVIGEGFYGLFVGIKIAEKGYNVKIFEKNTKPLFINKLRLMFPDNYTYIKKLLNKLNISYEFIHNNITNISSVISSLDKMPTSLQQDTLFKDTCNNILNKHTINLLKNEIYEIEFLFNIDTESAIQLIKKTYINVNNYIKITESSLSILKKMRDYFKSLNGQIYYNNKVYSIIINSSNQFICNINNRNWYSNILISTLNIENNLNVFNWNDHIKNNFINMMNVKNKKVYKLILNKSHISIPIKYKTSIKKFNFNNKKTSNILGNDIHFYVCNEDFSNTPYWINGTIDIVNEITKYI
jgi:hypothetical protein